MNKFTHEVLYEKFKDFLKEKSVKEKIYVDIDIYEDEDESPSSPNNHVP